MRTWFVILTVLACATAATAEEKAAFLGTGTYTFGDGCDKLKALAAGGDRNISTVPQTLTADGYQGWEHGCSVKSVSETAPGKAWTVVTSCIEGDSEWDDTQTFEKTAEGGFKVTGEGEEEPTVYSVCDAPAVPKGN